jgi:hypothetical protein
VNAAFPDWLIVQKKKATCGTFKHFELAQVRFKNLTWDIARKLTVSVSFIIAIPRFF